MEEYAQITLDQWIQWKEDIRQKLAETANNFVYIGYRLKQIRDSGMYDGAADIFEFAQKEYGLGKSTVSRFIAINEKYSEGGNSLELREEFRSFSSSKLSEMLTLPDNEIQLINERTTVRAIRELKQFNVEDPEAIQEAEEAQMAAGEQIEKIYTPLEKCIIDFFKTRRQMLDEVMELLEQGTEEAQRQAAELMTPSGQAFHKKGLVFLFLYEWGDGIKYKLMTEPEPIFMSWPDFMDKIRLIFGRRERIEEVYVELEEKAALTQSESAEPPVATSQQKPEAEPEQEADQNNKRTDHDNKNEEGEAEDEQTGEAEGEKNLAPAKESTEAAGVGDHAESVEAVQAENGDRDAGSEEGAEPEKPEVLATVDDRRREEADRSEDTEPRSKEAERAATGQDQESQSGSEENEELRGLREKAEASAEKIRAELAEGPKKSSEYRRIRERAYVLGKLLAHIVEAAEREELACGIDYDELEGGFEDEE